MRSSRPDNGGERRSEQQRALPNGSARFARRVLLVSFLLSLLVHAIVALGVRYDAFHPHNDDIERVTVERRPRVMSVTPKTPAPHTPTPPPTPVPQTPPPSPASSARPRTAASVAPNGLHAATKGAPATPAGGAPPTAAPSPTPTPVATVAAACASADAPPTLLGTPPPPALTPEVRHAAKSGDFKVAVSVDERGVVTDASMQISTGNPGADIALVTMARGAHYAPATKGCKPVAGVYVMVVRLAPW